jgi:hypothetical protein
MLEELNDNLQNADGQAQENVSENTTEIKTELVAESETSSEIEAQTELVADTEVETVLETTEEVDTDNEVETIDENVFDTAEPTATVQEIIDEHIAEANEEGNISQNESISIIDFSQLNMDQIVAELRILVQHSNIMAVKNNVEDGKKAFLNLYFQFIDDKKKEFYAENVETAEFEYHLPIKHHFDELYNEFRTKRNKQHNQLQNQFKQNLEDKTKLIDELKALIDSGNNNMADMFKKFNDIRERWKTSGAIPKDKYNLVWNNFHFHVDRFYEIVHLDREIRDADFKHNLEQKLQIIEKAKVLVNETNLGNAFRQLQQLHRVWKEEIGPVDRENREKIWNEFTEITKVLHDKKEALANTFKEKENENLAVKQQIIANINAIANEPIAEHNAWQKQLVKIEEQREAFFKAGRVPAELSESTWSEFKGAIRNFNVNKNAFYKDIKNEQQHNLEKKQALITQAKSYLEAENFDEVTPIMKKLQADWKTIGHVPRKVSDSIWAEFRAACNAYFDKIKESRKEEDATENENFDKKKDYLETLKTFELVGDHKTDLDAIKAHIAAWKEFGHVPQNKRHIEGKFNKVLDVLFEKLSLSKKDSEMLKFNNRLERLSEDNDSRAIANEQVFMRKKVDELTNEINQLENNVQFFSNSKGKNPFVAEVMKSIDRHKEDLATMKEKLKKLQAIN